MSIKLTLTEHKLLQSVIGRREIDQSVYEHTQLNKHLFNLIIANDKNQQLNVSISVELPNLLISNLIKYF